VAGGAHDDREASGCCEPSTFRVRGEVEGAIEADPCGGLTDPAILSVGAEKGILGGHTFVHQTPVERNDDRRLSSVEKVGSVIPLGRVRGTPSRHAVPVRE
jgi:hypothetical protein